MAGLGIDFGTSGARAIARDAGGAIVFEHHISFDHSGPLAVLWQNILWELLGRVPRSLAQGLEAIAINGTSGTVLLCDALGTPQTEPLLYNDARAQDDSAQDDSAQDDRAQTVAERIRAIAPPNHTVLSPSSSLSKLLWWQQVLGWRDRGIPPGWKLLHQADWLAGLLHGQVGISDYHNALKLGYDPGALAYPQWLWETELRSLLPQVIAPGQVIGAVRGAIAQQFGLNPRCVVCAGTTDSIAAFLASGLDQPGDAVTSLGSTLVLKLLSKTRVDDVLSGVYSHRWGDLWLVGGASNTGGAVLKTFWEDEELRRLSEQIDPAIASPLHYYPLLKPGERFPWADPVRSPQLQPRPASDVDFLHGLLESMARIEAEGYRRLQALGSTPLGQVLTAGGGAQNSAWSQIRQRHLGVPVGSALQTQAAYGTAGLAQGRFRQQHNHIS